MKNQYEILQDGTVCIYVTKYGAKLPLVKIHISQLARADEFPNTWCIDWDKKGKTYYVYGKMTINGKRKTVYLHRWLTITPDGLEVDHIHHNGLDNRPSAIRVVTSGENKKNRRDKTVPFGDPNGMNGWVLSPRKIKKDAFSPKDRNNDTITQQNGPDDSLHPENGTCDVASSDEKFSLAMPHIHNVPLGRFSDYADEWMVLWIGHNVMQDATDERILKHMCSLGHDRDKAVQWIDFVRTQLNRANPA